VENGVPWHHSPVPYPRSSSAALDMFECDLKNPLLRGVDVWNAKKHFPPPPHRSQVNQQQKQAVLLTWLHRSSGLPNFLSDAFRIRSALQWRDRAGFSPVFPIKPLRAPAFSYSVVFLWPIRLTKKSLCTMAKRQISYWSISFPSLVGQTVIPNRQFSWLCFIARPVFPIPQWHRRIRSALQWRDRAGFPPVFPI